MVAGNTKPDNQTRMGGGDSTRGAVPPAPRIQKPQQKPMPSAGGSNNDKR